MFNTVTLEGWATKANDGEFGDGTKWCNFTLSVSHYAGKNDDGTSKYNRSFFDIKTRRFAAESATSIVPAVGSDDKGPRVIVSGELRQESWEKDGVKRYAVVVYADEIRVVGEAARQMATTAPGRSNDFTGDEPF